MTKLQVSFKSDYVLQTQYKVKKETIDALSGPTRPIIENSGPGTFYKIPIASVMKTDHEWRRHEWFEKLQLKFDGSCSMLPYHLFNRTSESRCGFLKMSLWRNLGVVTVLGAIGSAADEAPALGCGGCLVTNDVSADVRS